MAHKTLSPLTDLEGFYLRHWQKRECIAENTRLQTGPCCFHSSVSRRSFRPASSSARWRQSQPQRRLQRPRRDIGVSMPSDGSHPAPDWARVQWQSKPSQVDRPMPRPGVCQEWLPSESRRSRGLKFFGAGEVLEGAADKEVQAKGAPRRETRQRPVGGETEPSTAWVTPQGDPVPLAFTLHVGAHWQTPGAQPRRASGKRTEKLDTRPTQEAGPQAGRLPRANRALRQHRIRRPGPMGPNAARRGCCVSMVAPVVAPHTRVCPSSPPTPA